MVITEKQIRQRATNKVYERGAAYYRQNMISSPLKRGDVIEAKCEASSQSKPYRVQATLKDNALVSTKCTCEYDFDGDCKHVVALLLTYLHEPESFHEQPPLKSALIARSKDELIALIEKMLARHPDLQTLVDIALIAGDNQQTQQVNTERYRKSLRQALKNHSPWDDDSRLDDALSLITADAEAFASAGHWQNASMCYCLILDEMLKDGVDTFMEGDDGIFDWIVSAIDGLRTCIGQSSLLQNMAARRNIQTTLLKTYIADVEWGGGGWADEIPEILSASVRQEDIAGLRTQLDAAEANAKKRSYNQWALGAYEEMRMQLDLLDSVDIEIILTRLREAGLHSLLIGKLLELNRPDEAVAIIEEQMPHPYQRLQEIIRVMGYGHEATALRLATTTVKRQYDAPIVAWLINRFKAQQDINALFEWQLLRMKNEPTALTHYMELQQTATTLGQWAAVRATIIDNLVKNRHYGLLTRIYLHEQAWEAAWDMLEKFKHGPKEGSFADSIHRYETGTYLLEIDVAEATRHVLPERALPVFVKHAFNEIDQRSREHYARAAAYLVIARDLYFETDGEDKWNQLLVRLRTDYKRLTALHDELNKVGIKA